VTASPTGKSVLIHSLLFPWDRATPVDCQVAVGVVRLDGDPNYQVSLVACWSLCDADGKELAMQRSGYSESTAAQNEILSQLRHNLGRAPHRTGAARRLTSLEQESA
jgi:hypothetical protein